VHADRVDVERAVVLRRPYTAASEHTSHICVQPVCECGGCMHGWQLLFIGVVSGAQAVSAQAAPLLGDEKGPLNSWRE